MPAPVEAHIAEIAEPCVHRNAQHRSLVVRIADFGVRHLGEVGDFQDAIEGLQQIAITALEHGAVRRGMAGDLQVEIIIVAAQALERGEVFQPSPQRPAAG